LGIAAKGSLQSRNDIPLADIQNRVSSIEYPAMGESPNPASATLTNEGTNTLRLRQPLFLANSSMKPART
jgi:hypothetical protein